MCPPRQLLQQRLPTARSPTGWSASPLVRLSLPAPSPSVALLRVREKPLPWKTVPGEVSVWRDSPSTVNTQPPSTPRTLFSRLARIANRSASVQVITHPIEADRRSNHRPSPSAQAYTNIAGCTCYAGKDPNGKPIPESRERETVLATVRRRSGENQDVATWVTEDSAANPHARSHVGAPFEPRPQYRLARPGCAAPRWRILDDQLELQPRPRPSRAAFAEPRGLGTRHERLTGAAPGRALCPPPPRQWCLGPHDPRARRHGLHRLSRPGPGHLRSDGAAPRGPMEPSASAPGRAWPHRSLPTVGHRRWYLPGARVGSFPGAGEEPPLA